MLKLLIIPIVFFALILPSQAMAEPREYHAFGFAITRGAHLFNESLELCYIISTKVANFKTTDSTELTESSSSELKDSIDAGVQTVLKLFEVPVSPCTVEKRKSLSTTMLKINAKVTQQKDDRELYKIEVLSDVGQAVRFAESNNYVRVNIRSANHVTLTRVQDEISQYIVDESRTQVEKAAVQFVEARKE
jgi:hypothetical protein